MSETFTFIITHFSDTTYSNVTAIFIQFACQLHIDIGRQ